MIEDNYFTELQNDTTGAVTNFNAGRNDKVVTRNLNLDSVQRSARFPGTQEAAQSQKRLAKSMLSHG